MDDKNKAFPSVWSPLILDSQWETLRVYSLPRPPPTPFTSFRMSVGSFMFLPNLSALPKILLSPSCVKAGNEGTETVEPGFNRNLETFPIPRYSGSYWFNLGSVANRISSPLDPDSLWAPCVPPHTRLRRNKPLIRQCYSTLCRDIFYPLYSSLVHIKDKMMITNHKIDFMSHWSRLPFENAVPRCPACVDWCLLPINTLGKGNLCHSRPKRQVGPGRKLRPGDSVPHLILRGRSIGNQPQQALHSVSRCMFVRKWCLTRYFSHCLSLRPT